MMPSCSTVTHRVARKEHRCYECGGTIAPLDVYECTSGIWDGSPNRFKVCQHCEEARDWLLEDTDWVACCNEAGGVDGEGAVFFYGQLSEHLLEQAREGQRKFAFRAYRFVSLMRRRRKAWTETHEPAVAQLISGRKDGAA